MLVSPRMAMEIGPPVEGPQERDDLGLVGESTSYSHGTLYDLCASGEGQVPVKRRLQDANHGLLEAHLSLTTGQMAVHKSLDLRCQPVYDE
jgi:hypothetical protein